MATPAQKKLVQQRLADIREAKNAQSKWFKWTGFQGKTFWDWLQLLGVIAIPLVVVGATIVFGIQQDNLAQKQHTFDQEIARLQLENEQQLARYQFQGTILQSYLDNLQDLILNHHLLGSKQTDDVAILARARTLTALQGLALDPSRKTALVKFLYEAHLIGFLDSKNKLQPPIIKLDGAELSGVFLEDASFNGVNLNNVFLNGVELNGAKLRDANLSNSSLFCTFIDINLYQCADLIRADLNHANLNHADLSNADLSNADLSFADLNCADISRNSPQPHQSQCTVLNYAKLSHANLSYADLSRADLTEADLSNAILTNATLTQQQLDQVQSCKNAILPPGLTCHHTPSP